MLDTQIAKSSTMISTRTTKDGTKGNNSRPGNKIEKKKGKIH